MFSNKCVTSGLLKAFKAVHIAAKLLGLAPYTFIRNTESHQETIDISWKHNRLSVSWSLTLLTAQAIATLFRIAWSFTQKLEFASRFFTEVMQFILVQFSGLVPIFLALTINRRKMVQLVTKLSAVDTDLNMFSDNIYKKHKTKIFICLVSFAVFIIPTHGFFMYFWQSYDIVNGITLSLADFTWLINDIEFVNVVMLLQDMLSLLNKRIESVFLNELRSRRTAPQTTGHVGRDRGYPRSTTSHFGSISELLELPLALQHLNTFNSLSVEAMCYESKATKRIVNCRKIYNKIYDVCCFVNSMYGFTLLLSTLTHIVCFVSDVASGIHFLVMPYTRKRKFDSEQEVIPFLACSITRALSIIAITLPCQKTSEEYQTCVDNVQELLLRTDQKDVIRQLKLFSSQLENSEIKFTAYGFFVVNLSLLTTLTGITVTYIILLVQI
jgi:hypothetical protein